jgi:hypothetical protein
MQSKSIRDMHKALRGYAVNFCPIVPVNEYFLGVEWLNIIPSNVLAFESRRFIVWKTIIICTKWCFGIKKKGRD